MNKTIKTAPNGKSYVISNEFKVGDIVAIHDKITGEECYRAVIKIYTKKEDGHFATLVNESERIYIGNTLATALVIESPLVNQAIYHFEQSTDEKKTENSDLAFEHEAAIFDIFPKINDLELQSYRTKLVQLDYVDASEYNRSENGLVTTKTFNK
jgi:hypothetical protein